VTYRPTEVHVVGAAAAAARIVPLGKPQLDVNLMDASHVMHVSCDGNVHAYYQRHERWNKNGPPSCSRAGGRAGWSLTDQIRGKIAAVRLCIGGGTPMESRNVNQCSAGTRPTRHGSLIWPLGADMYINSRYLREIILHHFELLHVVAELFMDCTYTWSRIGYAFIGGIVFLAWMLWWVA